MNNVVSSQDQSFSSKININKQTPNQDVLVSKILDKILNASIREISFEPSNYLHLQIEWSWKLEYINVV